jgi:hypothetical protein
VFTLFMKIISEKSTYYCLPLILKCYLIRRVFFFLVGTVFCSAEIFVIFYFIIQLEIKINSSRDLGFFLNLIEDHLPGKVGISNDTKMWSNEYKKTESLQVKLYILQTFEFFSLIKPVFLHNYLIFK